MKNEEDMYFCKIFLIFVHIIGFVVCDSNVWIQYVCLIYENENDSILRDLSNIQTWFFKIKL